jgi:hypothetical protein
MMEFKFSELARLYLKNLDVVKAARDAYEADSCKIAESLEKRITALIAPQSFNGVNKRPYRHWWVGEGTYQDAYLYLNRRDPDYINHEGIALSAATDRDDRAILDALGRLVDIDALALTGRDEPVKYDVFGLDIKFAGDDFIEETAQKIAAVLRAMHEVVASTANTETAIS